MPDFTAFGPQGPNYTTTRPPRDPKASAGLDTWFKNCSAAGAKDGTFATADFFNVTIGNLRYLCREAGITLDDLDDTMVYQAVLALIAMHAGGGGGGGSAPIIPQARIGTSFLPSMPFGTYVTHSLSLVSTVAGLAPVIAGDNLSVSFPAGRYLLISNASTRIVVNNTTQTSQADAFFLNGSRIGQSLDTSQLLAGQDSTVDHAAIACATVASTDVFTFTSRCGTTFSADYNLGQGNSGFFDAFKIA